MPGRHTPPPSHRANVVAVACALIGTKAGTAHLVSDLRELAARCADLARIVSEQARTIQTLTTKDTTP